MKLTSVICISNMSKDNIKKAVLALLVTTILISVVFWIYKNFFMSDQNVLLTPNEQSEYKYTKKNVNGEKFLYDNIFNDPKFRALQDRSIIRLPNLKPGNKNPFQAR